MTRLFAALLSLSILAPAGALADAANGQRLAERWCAACHVIAAGQKSGNTQAPPFSEVAKGHMDAPALALFLLNPHPKMPDMNLTRGEATDLAAYIKSQK